MAIKLIISDVDGCISPESSVPWDLSGFMEFARLVREANAGDGRLAPLTLCTGRPQPYTEVLMKLLDVRVPAICENGAVLYTLADNYARYGPGITEEKLLGLRALREHIETEILPAFPQTVLQFGKEAQMSLFSSQPEVFTEIKPRLEAFLHEHHGPAMLINDSHYYLNISLQGVDKGAAIRQLLSELGLRREEVAGIGDTEGDLPLCENVGFFACPANARDAVKQVAHYISPHPLLAGMLDILNHPTLHRLQV